MTNLNIHFQKCKQDYRHIICIGITLTSIGLGFLFPNALPRVGETVRDFFTSLAYYFMALRDPYSNSVTPTINDMQSWKFAEELWEPIKLFPYTWEEFKVIWSKYWDVVFTKTNFVAYLDSIGEFLSEASLLLTGVIPLLFGLLFYFNGYKNKSCTDRGKKSFLLRSFEKMLFKVIYPVVAWLKDFVSFVKEEDKYYKTWLVIWALYFNVFSIFIAFMGYYLYLSASRDFVSLYTQLLKLLRDLTPVIRFIPGIIWFFIGVWIYNYVCRSMAFARLYALERANRAVLKKRGIITTVYGPPGLGKTMTVTSMAVSKEIDLYDILFGIMVERATWFPNFPWQTFRDQIKKRVKRREIVDVDSCREWVQRCRVFFDRISAIHTADEYKVIRKRYKHIKTDYTFGYDYTHYSTTYNNELKITHLYEALEEYACAYIYFTVKTTLLFANYSIRMDSILKDLGNLPYRDNDFFNRPPEYREAVSKHSHIIDMDMFRLGKKLIPDNPKARGIHPSVYVITEVDKEWKNTIQLQEIKAKSDETNQKNDLHDAALMMIRHAVLIANIPIIALIFDLQRPEAWGAGGRELGEVINLSEKSDAAPVLPFLSPYWFCEWVFRWLQGKWDDFKNTYDVNRCDQTLLVYLISNLMAKINNHYDKILGMFGAQTITLEMQSGRMDGKVDTDKWRWLFKKDFSERYRSDCLHSVWVSYEPNTMYVDDFISYAGLLGTQEENELQNSYFQNDIKKMKRMNRTVA